MKFLKRKMIFVLTTALVLQGVNIVPVHAKASRNTTGNGFKLVKKNYVSAIKSTVMQYEHVKSGAKLVYLKNDDSNKTFSVSFRTLPSDNTGINHILEHSVLDGSKKYPVNNLILNMANQSLCSDINAYTQNDYTDYHFSSRNDKDFMNCLDVMMDSVFHPRVLKNRNIFLQEAGHYELNKEKNKANYNGIVYNEVRGKMGSSFEKLCEKSVESVFERTTYKWDAGGTTESIPDAKYSDLVKAYNKYYKPSNSIIYLYGKLDIDKVLKYLNNNYLSKYTKEKVNAKAAIEEPFKRQKEKTYYYYAGKEKSTSNNTYFAMNYVIDMRKNYDVEKTFDGLLYDAIYSKLNNAAKNKGLGKITIGLTGGGAMQKVFTIASGKLPYEKKAAFRNVINTTLNSIVKSGLSKSYIKSLLNSYSNQQEGEYKTSRGMDLNTDVINSWLNNGNITSYLDDRYIKILKKELKEKYIENMIKEYILNNKFSSFVTLKAKAGEDPNDRGTININALSKKRISRIINDEKNMKKWQSEAGSEKALSTLPVLSVSDIKAKKPDINISEDSDGVKMMFTPVNAGKASSLSMYFDTSMIEKDKIPYINLMCAILNKDSSNVGFEPYAFEKFDDAEKISPKIVARFSGSYDKLEKALESLKGMMTKAKFSDKKMVKDQLKASCDIAKQYAPTNHGLSYLSETDRYNDDLSGLGYYNFANKLHMDFDSKWGETEKNLQDVYDRIFNRNNLIIGFAGTKEGYSSLKLKLPDFLKSIKYYKYTPIDYNCEDNVKNEAFIDDSQNIDSIFLEYNIRKLGYEYNGKVYVMGAIANEYLTNKIRQTGGYGGRMKAESDGNIYLQAGDVSDIDSIFSIFKALPLYLKNFKADKHVLLRYKISAIKELLYEDSPMEQAIQNQEDAVEGKTAADYEREIKQVMATKDKDIRDMSSIIQGIIKQNVFFVIGNKDKINANKDIFTNIIDINE
ncbi:insulinase family protein [Clostridium oryzae]|uniref:Peptidase M16C associated n=1 Tax=Clostridium oryzae TaxID=1450648 RepID=A0A1V4IQR7_9CLOT|nr:insulinase family protein [Clostridium oryzae]OPJ62266.1 peptidase M16C associated [Clostridium oryzae]